MMAGKVDIMRLAHQWVECMGFDYPGTPEELSECCHISLKEAETLLSYIYDLEQEAMG